MATGEHFDETSTLADGATRVYGYGGDIDPDFVIEEVDVRNDTGSALDLYVACTRDEAEATNGVRATHLGAGESHSRHRCKRIALHNASGGTVTFNVSFRRAKTQELRYTALTDPYGGFDLTADYSIFTADSSRLTCDHTETR